MKHSLLIIAVVAIALSLTAPTHAQFGSRSLMTQAFEPYVKQRDLPILMETLQLEEWQRPIVDTLVEDYLASFNAGIEKLRVRMQEAGSSNEKGDLGALLRPLQTWSQERQEIYARFAELVRSQLSPQQIERWPVWERAVRRERLLPQSELSGEGTNLVGVLTDLAPPAEFRSAAAPAIEAYEIRVDQALTARQARENEILPAMMDAMATLDHQRASELQEKVMIARVALRDAQEQGIAEIALAMGNDWGPKFRALAQQRAFPEVFAPNAVMRIYDAALALPDLSEEARSSISGLKTEFQREWDGLSEEFLTVVKREEPKAPKNRMAEARPAATPEARQARAGEIEAIRRRRHELGERYRALLEKQLTPEAYASLPGTAKYAAEGLGSKFGGSSPAESATQGMRSPGGRSASGGGDKGAGSAGSAEPTPSGNGAPARNAPPSAVE